MMTLVAGEDVGGEVQEAAEQMRKAPHHSRAGV